MQGEEVSGGRWRLAIKAAVFAVSLAVVSPLIGLVWLEKHVLRGEVLFVLCSQTLALVPGILELGWLRGAYYFGTLEALLLGKHTSVSAPWFTHQDAVVGARLSTGTCCLTGPCPHWG